MRDRDIDIVARLRVAAFFQGTARTLARDAADLRRLLSGDGFEAALVARLDGAAIGAVLLVRQELPPAHDLTPWLAGLVVDENHRRRGIGTALVRAIEAHARSVDVSRVYLYTWQARDFYAGLGWKELENCQQDGEPMLLMCRDLGS